MFLYERIFNKSEFDEESKNGGGRENKRCMVWLVWARLFLSMIDFLPDVFFHN